MDGLLLIDKPAGPTSHDVVARMRRALREKRIGHTGTLDPAATGLLCLVLGRATRLAQFLTATDKTYEAVVRFGFATDTRDADGRPVGPVTPAVPSRAAIESALDAFRGTFLQQPPAFSAKKIGGKRSHELARTSRLVSDTVAQCLTPAAVTVHALRLVDVDEDTATLTLTCSAGFYVRSLAHDLGERLGVGAHLAALRRTRSGDFAIERAIALDAAERDPAFAAASVIPMADMLPSLPAVYLTPDGVTRARNGCVLDQRDRAAQRDGVTGESRIPSPESLVRLVSGEGGLVGIARADARPALLHPFVVLM